MERDGSTEVSVERLDPSSLSRVSNFPHSKTDVDLWSELFWDNQM